MRPQNSARQIDDLPRQCRFGAQLENHIGITSAGHETDILAVRLLRHRQIEPLGQDAGFVLAHSAERKAQIIELLARCRKQEIALILAVIGGAMQLGAVRPHDTADIMARRQRIGTEILCCFQQIAEFDGLIAQHAGHRRLAADIAVGEAVDHVLAEPAFVIQHIMRDADLLRDTARIGNILTGAARPLALYRRPMIVKLQGDPDDVIALLRQQRGGDGRIDAARHRDDDTGLRHRLIEGRIGY